MVLTLTLPSPLLALIRDNSRETPVGRSVGFCAGSWIEFVDELRARYPALADRTLDDNGTVREDFVLVVNGHVIGKGNRPHLEAMDEISFIAQISGG